MNFKKFLTLLTSALIFSPFSSVVLAKDHEITYGEDLRGYSWVLYQGKGKREGAGGRERTRNVQHIFCRCPSGDLYPVEYKKWDGLWASKLGDKWKATNQCASGYNNATCPPPGNYDQLARNHVCQSVSSPGKIKDGKGCGDKAKVAELQNSTEVRNLINAIQGASGTDQNTIIREYKIDGDRKHVGDGTNQVDKGSVVGKPLEFGAQKGTSNNRVVRSVSVPLEDGTFAIFCQCLGLTDQGEKDNLTYPDQPTDEQRKKGAGNRAVKARRDYCSSLPKSPCPITATDKSLAEQISGNPELEKARDRVLQTLHLLNRESDVAFNPIPPTASGTPRLCAWSKGFTSIEGKTVLPTVTQVKFGNEYNSSTQALKEVSPLENFCSRATTCVGQAVCTPNTVFQYAGTDYSWESIGRSNGVSSNSVFTEDPIEYPESFDLYHVVCRGDQCNQQADPKKLFDATSTHTNCSFSKVF